MSFDNWTSRRILRAISVYGAGRGAIAASEKMAYNCVERICYHTDFLGHEVPLSLLWRELGLRRKQTRQGEKIRIREGFIEIPGLPQTRYSIAVAHEIAHEELARLAPTSTPRGSVEIAQEEVFCNVLAMAILMPIFVVRSVFPANDTWSANHLLRLRRMSQSDIGTMLRRLCYATGTRLIIWSNRAHSKKGGQRRLRVQSVCPNSRYISSSFIPTDKTVRNAGISPDIVSRSYHERESNEGFVDVNNLFGVNPGRYKLRNIFVEDWTSQEDLVERTRMAVATYFKVVEFGDPERKAGEAWVPTRAVKLCHS